MRTKIFLLSAIVALAGCQSSATSPSPAETLQEMAADQIMFGVEHRMTSSGIRRAVLYGDTAYVQQGGGMIDVVGVRMVFFDENGRETGNLTSRTGKYQLRAGTMIAEGNVVLRTEGENTQRVLETEQLHFDVNGDRLWSDQAVTMREGGRTIRGTSFQSDGRFQNVTIQRAQTSGAPLNTPDGGISF
jgi:LPS export ABC transporter protein LptC